MEEVDRPALQCLRQHGVVGVGTGANHNVPGLHTETTSEKIFYLTLAEKLDANTFVIKHPINTDIPGDYSWEKIGFTFSQI